MLFDIRHETGYQYNQSVFLEPHLLRIRPRSDWSQRLLAFDMEISPEPDGCTRLIDLDGNSTMRPWFSGMHDHLTIITHSTVETLVESPFDYLLDPAADSLPVDYGAQAVQLASYLSHNTDSAVAELAAQIVAEADSKPVDFASLLNQRIQQMCPTEVRLEGDPLTPAQTLARGHGACRDVSVLFMEVCRTAGLAARFTSGYAAGSPDQARYLHAWAEVYLPGAGWRGYDPSLGLVVADRHVALASGPDANAARPFDGRFRGNGVESTMSVQLQISTTESERGE